MPCSHVHAYGLLTRHVTMFSVSMVTIGAKHKEQLRSMGMLLVLEMLGHNHHIS